MRFDARAAKLLKPGEHIIVDGCPGLRLVATESRRSWIYRFKSPLDQRMKQTRIGQWPAMAPAEAITAWSDLRTRRDAGENPVAEKKLKALAKPAGPGYTVRRLCDDYLDGHIAQNRKPKGAKEVRRMLDTMLASIEDLQAVALTRSLAFDLLQLYMHIPVQAGYLRGELGAAWDYALDAGRIPDTTPNWWRMIMRGRFRSKGKKIAGESIGPEKKIVPEQQLGELIRWLPNFSKNVADVLTVYLWTGTRGSEIVAMERSEVDEEADGLWWTIPKHKTKNANRDNATELRVPLIGRAATVVNRRMELHERWVFQSGAAVGHLEQKTIQTGVFYHQPYCKIRPESERPRLTVSHWSPHDLRRTVRTMLASMGCPDSVAEAILGHVQEGIKGTYNRYQYDAERREWLTKLSARLEHLSGPP